MARRYLGIDLASSLSVTRLHGPAMRKVPARVFSGILITCTNWTDESLSSTMCSLVWASPTTLTLSPRGTGDQALDEPLDQGIELEQSVDSVDLMFLKCAIMKVTDTRKKRKRL